MQHLVVSDTALSALVIRVWRARGGCIPPLHAIAVDCGDRITLRLIDLRPEVHVIGLWTISDYSDVPDSIRLLEERDRNIMGLVFHGRRSSEGCFWEFVDPRTLAASRMFARVWRAPYGEI